MAKSEKGGDKPWVTLVVAILPALIAGWFSLKAIEKANASAAASEKTSGELTVAYDLMKQALEVVQHEADAGREALQKTNELLIKLLQQRPKRNHEEAAMLATAEELDNKLRQPYGLRPHFPPNLHDLSPRIVQPSPAP